ncbi:MAG: hypothetical protein PF904_04485 [Kiritimatiellae bacterium]|nr:hypothetical protein [Kiritimatiellia bacterium]
MNVDGGEGGAALEGVVADVGGDADGDGDGGEGCTVGEGGGVEGDKCISRYWVAEWQGGRCAGQLTDPRDREIRALHLLRPFFIPFLCLSCLIYVMTNRKAN